MQNRCCFQLNAIVVTPKLAIKCEVVAPKLEIRSEVACETFLNWTDFVDSNGEAISTIDNFLVKRI